MWCGCPTVKLSAWWAATLAVSSGWCSPGAWLGCNKTRLNQQTVIRTGQARPQISDLPSTAISIPPMLVTVTGFFSSSRDTLITAILLVTLATAYVSGVTILRRVKARRFCSQWRTPSTNNSSEISLVSSLGILGASTCRHDGQVRSDSYLVLTADLPAARQAETSSRPSGPVCGAVWGDAFQCPSELS